MKRDFLLFAALAAVGVGLYLIFSRGQSTAKVPAAATTGTNPFTPYGSFAQGSKGNGITFNVGNPGGAGSGASIDLAALLKEGILAAKKIFGGQSKTVGQDPAISIPAPRASEVSAPQYSTWADYGRVQQESREYDVIGAAGLIPYSGGDSGGASGYEDAYDGSFSGSYDTELV